MRRLLRSFLNWLDRKFPDKVVVTAERYMSLEARVTDQEKLVAALAKQSDDRLKALETQMANTQLALGFTAPKMGVLER